jgi:hypothetical protein
MLDKYLDEHYLIFSIAVEDVQKIAMDKLGRELTVEELDGVKKGVEYGLVIWDEVVRYAINEAVKLDK